MDNLDKNEPNLFVGKLIGNSHLEGKVISFDDNSITVEITKLNDKYYERYVDLGKSYPLVRLKHWQGNLLMWEVDPQSMKRSVSQLLLQWEKNIGWTWDLDS